jgi:ubiquinone biosynthesis protein COQ4
VTLILDPSSAAATPEELGDAIEQIAIGYWMGAKAKPFLAQKWEAN